MIDVGDFGIFGGFPGGVSSSNVRSSVFLFNVSGGIDVKGVGCLVMVAESVVRGLGVSVGGFGTGEVFVGSFFCVGGPSFMNFLLPGVPMLLAASSALMPVT